MGKQAVVQSSLGPQQSCWPWAASSLGHATFLTTLRLTGFSVAWSATRPVTQTQIVVIHTCMQSWLLPEGVSVPPVWAPASQLGWGRCPASLLDLLTLKIPQNQTKLAYLPDLNIICTWGRGKKNYFLLIHATYMKHLAFQSRLKTDIFFSILLSLWSCSLTQMMLDL